MKIICVYTEKDYAYVKSISDALFQQGYNAEIVHKSSISINKNTPFFGIEKHGKIGYIIEGKRDLGYIYKWVENSGV